MAGKLTPQEWQTVKQRWEVDPRPGYQWIVNELSLPCSIVAVHKRAKKEQWGKSVNLKSIVNRAQLKADQAHSKILGAGFPSGVNPESPEMVNLLTNVSVDLRSAVIETHRAEWQRHRVDYDTDVFMLAERTKVLRAKYDGVEYAEVMIEEELKKPGVVEFSYYDLSNFARCAKIMAEAIKVRQEGERKAWGLDATNDDTSSGMETVDELNARYAASMERTAEMEKKARERNGGQSGHTLN